MTRIDRDDDIATGNIFFIGSFDRTQVALLVQVDDQSITILFVGTCRETA